MTEPRRTSTKTADSSHIHTREQLTGSDHLAQERKTDMPHVEYMNRKELRALMNLLMVSDPSPLSSAEDAALRDVADRVAMEFGYHDWIDAYHNLPNFEKL